MHDQQLSAGGSSMGSWDRGKEQRWGYLQRGHLGGSLLPPFQAGSFHYLSPHPAPGELWFRDTRSHLLLRKPQGQEAGHHPGEQTHIEKRTGEGKAESVGRRTSSKTTGAVGKSCPGSLRGETGEESRAEERTESGGIAEPARQGYEPHCTLAPSPSRCRMEYFRK